MPILQLKFVIPLYVVSTPVFWISWVANPTSCPTCQRAITQLNIVISIQCPTHAQPKNIKARLHLPLFCCHLLTSSRSYFATTKYHTNESLCFWSLTHYLCHYTLTCPSDELVGFLVQPSSPEERHTSMSKLVSSIRNSTHPYNISQNKTCFPRYVAMSLQNEIFL